MRKPASMKALEKLGRVRLSEHFFMREMLYSEIANFHGIPNIPDDPDLAVAAGTQLCEELLEPLHATFGHVTIRSAFRSVEVNIYGHERSNRGYNCGETAWNYARHVWDRRDSEGSHGERPLASSSPGSSRATRPARPGRRWPGGCTTTCRTPTWRSSPTGPR